MLDYIYGLKFQFVPVAHIRDYRFALVFYFFLTVAFIYSIGGIFWLHQDLTYTPATAMLTTWFRSFRNPSNVLSNPYYCDNATYNFELTPAQKVIAGNYQYNNVSCQWFDDAVVTRMSGNSAGITTALISLVMDPHNSSNISSVQYFTTDFDSLGINFQHSVNVPNIGPVLNPPTTLYDHQGKVYRRFGVAGEPPFVSLSFNEIFDIVGMGLDDLNPQPGTEFPPIRYRNTGMLVSVMLNYQNAVTWEIGTSLQCAMTMTVQQGSWGQMGWITPGSSSFIRTGVVLNMVVSGELGSFSFTTLVAHLISSYVLISVCRTAVVMIIKFISAFDDGFAERHKLELAPSVFCSAHHADVLAGGSDHSSGDLLSDDRAGSPKSASINGLALDNEVEPQSLYS
jgi:hypothetical protein